MEQVVSRVFPTPWVVSQQIPQVSSCVGIFPVRFPDYCALPSPRPVRFSQGIERTPTSVLQLSSFFLFVLVPPYLYVFTLSVSFFSSYDSFSRYLSLEVVFFLQKSFTGESEPTSPIPLRFVRSVPEEYKSENGRVVRRQCQGVIRVVLKIWRGPWSSYRVKFFFNGRLIPGSPNGLYI